MSRRLDLSALAIVELDRLEEQMTRAQQMSAGTAEGGHLDLGCFADALALSADVRAEQAVRQWQSAEAIERYVRADNKTLCQAEGDKPG